MSQITEYRCDMCHGNYKKVQEVLGFEFSTSASGERLVIKPAVNVHRHWCHSCIEVVYSFVNGQEYGRVLELLREKSK